MKWVVNFIIGILSLVLILSLFLLPLVQTFHATFFNEAFILSLLHGMDITPLTTKIIHDVLPQAIQDRVTPQRLARLNQAFSHALVEDVSLLLSRYYAYFQGESQEFDTMLELSRSRDILKEELYLIFRNSAEEESMLESAETFNREFDRLWEEASIPDRIDLSRYMDRKNFNTFFQYTKRIYQLVLLARTILIITVLAAFLLVGLLKQKIKAILVLYGKILIPAAILTFICGLPAITFRLLRPYLAPLLEGISFSELSLLVQRFFQPIIIFAGVYLIAGIILLTLGNNLQEKANPDPQE